MTCPDSLTQSAELLPEYSVADLFRSTSSTIMLRTYRATWGVDRTRIIQGKVPVIRNNAPTGQWVDLSYLDGGRTERLVVYRPIVPIATCKEILCEP
jgi:hypothetical protein